MLDIGLQGDSVKLNEALAACPFGYGEVGVRLADESNRDGSGVVIMDGQ